MRMCRLQFSETYFNSADLKNGESQNDSGRNRMRRLMNFSLLVVGNISRPPTSEDQRREGKKS